ncbi:hypothetical protein OSB04_000269 [Centaurea solstitialis]|uniref:UDP-glycosyltransferase n=1 Tax=Centaurea solstitialis TaxID=347529 RepID=A0AA38TW85_9ASTR|nr:hypothetical protein OSB04_000269 [Centaurea solstitialis]
MAEPDQQRSGSHRLDPPIPAPNPAQWIRSKVWISQKCRPWKSNPDNVKKLKMAICNNYKDSWLRRNLQDGMVTDELCNGESPNKTMAKPHVLVIPYPAQGHVMPMMELAQRLVIKGIKVTFVNTEVNHKLVATNCLDQDGFTGGLMEMVSIADGLEPWEDRTDLCRLTTSILQSMACNLEELIEKINKGYTCKITCVIADGCMGWAIKVAKKMGIRRAAFWPASVASLASILSFQKLIDDGIIDNDGIPLQDQMIRLSETLPPLKPANLPWTCFEDPSTVKVFFKLLTEAAEAIGLTKWFICNSATELEPAAFSLYPQLVPIGPLLANNRLANQSGHFWHEDSTCLPWLDQQSAGSVIYIAFGSFTIINQTQFEELALGLELCNRPFLWVVRPGMTKETTVTYPDGFMERIGSHGRIVSWAPQQKVLAHPSVACFLSHCGWNSTLEGMTNGLPFLCWPYFADQLYNEDYICDIWKMGLRFTKDETGIIRRGEIKSKVEEVLSNKKYVTRVLDMKEKITGSIKEGGRSHKNLGNFIEWVLSRVIHGNIRFPAVSSIIRWGSLFKSSRGGFKCEPLFGCERENSQERDTWRMTRRHSNFQESPNKTMAKTHVLVIPFPAQGHVMPIMELAQRLVAKDIKVTFVNTEVNHKLVTTNWLDQDGFGGGLLEMVSIPDGLEPWEDRTDLGRLTTSMLQSMAGKLEELIEKINKGDGNKITCVIADGGMGWAIKVAKKMGIRRAAFWPASVATLASIFSFQTLIDDGIIDNNGLPLQDKTIRLSETMPPLKPSNLPWTCFVDPATVKILFQLLLEAVEAARLTEWFICNSSTEFEPAAFNLYPQLVPIGPLRATDRLANQTGHFWQEDSTCLSWLDQQPVGSVIYIAFGSFTIINQTQFEELALGLELCNRPFLWVVRPGMTKETIVTYPDGFIERVGSHGRIVNWAPQQKVLAHPSVACFLSHCGWNSTLEGMTSGQPFLCWPYFADQFNNEDYICDIWKTGMRFEKDETGIIRRGEIKSKVEEVLSNKNYVTRALEMKEKVTGSIKEGGHSHENLGNFIDWIQEKDTNQCHGST